METHGKKLGFFIFSDRVPLACLLFVRRRSLRQKRGVGTWVGIGREGQHPVRDAEHQALGVDGLAAVGPLVGLLDVTDGEGAAAVLTGK